MRVAIGSRRLCVQEPPAVASRQPSAPRAAGWPRARVGWFPRPSAAPHPERRATAHPAAAAPSRPAGRWLPRKPKPARRAPQPQAPAQPSAAAARLSTLRGAAAPSATPRSTLLASTGGREPPGGAPRPAMLSGANLCVQAWFTKAWRAKRGGNRSPRLGAADGAANDSPMAPGDGGDGHGAESLSLLPLALHDSPAMIVTLLDAASSDTERARVGAYYNACGAGASRCSFCGGGGLCPSFALARLPALHPGSLELPASVSGSHQPSDSARPSNADWLASQQLGGRLGEPGRRTGEYWRLTDRTGRPAERRRLAGFGGLWRARLPKHRLPALDWAPCAGTRPAHATALRHHRRRPPPPPPLERHPPPPAHAALAGWPSARTMTTW